MPIACLKQHDLAAYCINRSNSDLTACKTQAWSAACSSIMSWILAGLGAEGNALIAARGPAMLGPDMNYAEFSSTPPLAAADTPIAVSRPPPAAHPAPSGALHAASDHQLRICTPETRQMVHFHLHGQAQLQLCSLQPLSSRC